MKRIICKEPWPAWPIDTYTTPDSGEWGYLVIYDDITFQFDTSIIPDRKEILAKWPQLDVGNRYTSFSVEADSREMQSS